MAKAKFWYQWSSQQNLYRVGCDTCGYENAVGTKAELKRERTAHMSKCWGEELVVAE